MKLSALKPGTLTVNVFMIYSLARNPKTGEIERVGRDEKPITMQLLTSHQWEEIGFQVDDPIPDKNADGTPNFTSMRYRTGRERAEYERNCRRLAWSLANAPEPEAASGVDRIEFESDPEDLEACAEELRQSVDAGVFNALLDQLRASANAFERTVDQQADSFRIGKRNWQLQKTTGEGSGS